MTETIDEPTPIYDRLVAGLPYRDPIPDTRPLEVADYQWATVWDRLTFRQCRARREPRGDGGFFGRCELYRGHDDDHALERGFDTPRWSTEWSDLRGTRLRSPRKPNRREAA